MGVNGQYWLGGEGERKYLKIGRLVFVWRCRVKVAERGMIAHHQLPSAFYFVSPARRC